MALTLKFLIPKIKPEMNFVWVLGIETIDVFIPIKRYFYLERDGNIHWDSPPPHLTCWRCLP